MTEPMTDEMISFEQVRALVQLNNSTVFNLLTRYKDEIEAWQKGREVFYSRKDVLEYLNHLIVQ